MTTSASNQATSRTMWLAVLIVGVSTGILVAHAYLYYPFLSDDALISLRYASRLLHGHGLTWTDGPPVEGYSNLLWVLLVAGLGAVHIDLVDATRLLGVLSGMTMLGALVASARSGSRAVGEWTAADWLAAGVGALFVTLSAPVAVWTIGGLEQPLVSALVALSIPLMFAVLAEGTPAALRHRRLLWLSAVLGLLSITRPDSPIFTVAAVTTLLLAGTGQFSTRVLSAAWLLVFPALTYGGQLLFRYWYYGALVPNTALVKLTLTATRRTTGLAYLWEGLRALSPFSFLALAAMIGLLVVPNRRGRALYLLLLSSMWSAYVVVIGGDIFPAYRHLVPVVVILAFALVELVQSGGPLLRGHRWVAAAVVAFLLVQFTVYAQGQYAQKQSQRAVTERWEWQCKDLGVLLKTAFSDRQPLLAVTAAGCLPYWSELPALDMMGLNDDYLPRHPPPDFGTGFIGHELGDGAYVLGRRPDIIVFSVGSEPSYRSGSELNAMPEFHRRYVPVAVRVEGNRDTPLVFFDRYSAKLGITQSASGVTVPGFLFSSGRTVAYLSPAGELVAAISRNEPARLSFASSFVRDWTITISGPHPDLVEARIEQDAGMLTIVLSTTQPGPVEVGGVTLRAPAGAGSP